MDIEPAVDRSNSDDWLEEDEPLPASAASADELCEAEAPPSELADRLLFHTKELGGQRVVNGVEVYLVSEYTESGLRDIIDILKREDRSAPRARETLLRWTLAKTNLVPLLLIQRENKAVLFKVFVLLNELTAPLSADLLAEFEQRESLAAGRRAALEALAQPRAVAALVDELCECVKTPTAARSEHQTNAIELIVALLRNMSAFREAFSAARDSETDEKFFARIVTLFAEPNGAFDAFVYLTQQPNGPFLTSLFVEAFAAVAREVRLEQILGELFEEQQLRRLREMEKLRAEERRNSVVADRHSRFGAAFTVRDGRDRRKTFSDLKKALRARPQQLCDRPIKNKILRPQRVGRPPPTETRKMVSKNIKVILKVFFLDFLEHSFIALLTAALAEQERQCPARLSDFFELVAFGLQAGLVLGLRETRRPWVAHCLQLGVLDLLFVAWRREARRRPRECDVTFLLSLARVLGFALGCVKELSASTAGADNRNALLLQRLLFSQDVPALLKLTAARVGRRLWPRLMPLADAFFGMLADFARDKVYTVCGAVESLDDDERALGTRSAAGRERQVSYLTELTRFLDLEWVKAHVELLRPEHVTAASPALLDAVLNLFRRLEDDVDARWVFFSADILDVLSEFAAHTSLFTREQPKLGELQKRVLSVFECFKRAFLRNSFLVVECLFGIRSFEEKESILNNYQIAAPTAENAIAEVIRANRTSTEIELPGAATDFAIAAAFAPSHLNDIAAFHRLHWAANGLGYTAEQLCVRASLLKLDGSAEAREAALGALSEKWARPATGELKAKARLFRRVWDDGDDEEIEAFFAFLLAQLQKLKTFRASKNPNVDFCVLFADKVEADRVLAFAPILASLRLSAPDPLRLSHYWRIPHFLPIAQIAESLEKAVREWNAFKVEMAEPRKDLKTDNNCERAIDALAAKDENSNLLSLLVGDESAPKIPTRKLSKLKRNV